MSAYYPLAVAVLATALALGLEHYALYHVRPTSLPAPLSYSLGSATVWAGFALWAYLSGDLGPAVALGVIYALAGGLIVLMHLAEGATAGEGHRREAEALRGVVRDGQE